MTDPIAHLLAGFRAFRARHHERRSPAWQRLVREGQRPEVLVVACSDSRVDPALLFGTAPGELFVVRNVAALVAPYGPDGRPHATAAALEYGIKVLAVSHVVVLGHSGCGGVAAAREGVPPGCEAFLGPWVAQIADDAAAAPDAAAAERAAVARSLAHLEGYPWVAEAVAAGRLALHGWRLDLDAGVIEGYDPAAGRFLPLVP